MEIIIDGPYYNYGKNYECNPYDKKLKFYLYSRASRGIDLNEAQRQALMQSISKIIYDKDVLVEKNTIIIPNNKYNEEHIETVKETITQTLSLL